jgi:iron complex outermembrane recepter protein
VVYFIKTTVLLCVLMSLSSTGNAQVCQYKISGQVLDGQKKPVPGVVVHLSKSKSGTTTDTAGNFQIGGVCPGRDSIIFEAVSYNKVSFVVNVDKDKTLKISLSSSNNELAEVMVNGEKIQELNTVTHTELTGLALLQTRGESLGETLKELPGLNSIQTGPSLSKPVIHGLHSNRVLIINDGVRQEGQQWGSEHAPEIDPFIANKITVVKGAASVRYGSDAIGGVVLLSPDDMPTLPGITGDVYVICASNGQMGAFSGMLQGAFDKKLKGLSWRIQGTAKDAGNFRTPGYYLTNTGLREGDFSANLCYKWKNLDLDAYYSLYDTKVGIFFGAESGNLAELQAKFLRGNPGIPSYFTYDINRPYQTVLHELLKTTAAYNFKNEGKLELTFGRQNDVRQEYDELSTGNPAAANSPQLQFQLITHTLDLIYTQHTKNGFSGSFGITGKTSGNIFEGVRSLIPNYRDYNGGAFAIERYSFGKMTFEAGLRYDYRWLRVYERNPNTLSLYNVTYQYSNATGTIGSTYHYNERLSASFNIGTAWRAPSINEMYIYGEHFSDASFQVGDSALKSERSANAGLTVKYTSHKFRATLDLYYNSISNYIYDKPALKYRVLPSGTFPEFDFTEANVNIKGIDGALQYDFLPRFTFQSKTTIVRGYNESIHDWLISMPSDRFENGVEFHLPKIGGFYQPYVSLENVSVLKQTRVPPNSDYVPQPAGYALFNANAGLTLPVKKNTLNVNFAVNNLTNVAYRDYLDHFRYYADELGINYILRLKYSF